MRLSALVLTLAFTTSLLAAAPKRRAALPDKCTAIITPAAISLPSTESLDTVFVSMQGCDWSPISSDSWLTATRWDRSTNSGFNVSAPGNPSPNPRTAFVHVRSYVVVVTQAGTTNLLQNGSFDSSLASWNSVRSNNGTPYWAAGAAVLTSGFGRGVAQLDQCVNIEPSTSYEAGTKVLIASGQPAGVVNFGMYEYWAPNCDPIVAYHGSIVKQAAGPTGSTFDMTATWTSDPNAKSVLIAIGSGSSTGPFTATFDDMYLRKKP